MEKTSGTRDIAFNDFFMIADSGHLGCRCRMTSQLENHYFRGFAMQNFVKNESSFFVLKAHLTPDKLLLMFF